MSSMYSWDAGRVVVQVLQHTLVGFALVNARANNSYVMITSFNVIITQFALFKPIILVIKIAPIIPKEFPE